VRRGVGLQGFTAFGNVRQRSITKQHQKLGKQHLVGGDLHRGGPRYLVAGIAASFTFGRYRIPVKG